MSEFAVQSLLETPTVTVRDVYCQGSSRSQSAEECATDTQLVFPYRGVYVATAGGLSGTLDAMLSDKSIYRSPQVLGPAYERPERLTNDSVEKYLRPLVRTGLCKHS